MLFQPPISRRLFCSSISDASVDFHVAEGGEEIFTISNIDMEIRCTAVTRDSIGHCGWSTHLLQFFTFEFCYVKGKL